MGLALKAALVVAAVLAVAGAGAVLVWRVPVAAVAVLAVAGSLSAGLAVHLLVERRVAEAADLLRQVQQHRFDAMDEPEPRNGDALDVLIGEVHRTGRTFRAEMAALRRAESYRREFLGDVSHELKTPIFSIQGFAETLLDGALNDASVNRTFVEKIYRNARRLGNLTSDLADISRIETGELKMAPAPFGLGRLVQEVLEGLELAAAARNVSLRADVPDGFPAVLADRERIRQVLTNLVENGIKYNNPGGAVVIHATRTPGGEARIAVADTGIGIAAQHLPRLTERFYRVDKSRSRDEGGTGLGLAITKHILGAHGRRLHIESTPGRGSTFAFELPLAD